MTTTNQKYLSREGDQVLIVDSLEKISSLAQVLSSKTRLKILYYLSIYGELSVKQLAELLKTPLPIVSRHVMKLEKKGLIITGLRNGKRGLKKVLRKRYKQIIIEI